MQPYKERVHPLYEYSGVEDPTHETKRPLPTDVADWWLGQLFDMASYQGKAQTMPSFKLSTPPPQVRLSNVPL